MLARLNMEGEFSLVGDTVLARQFVGGEFSAVGDTVLARQFVGGEFSVVGDTVLARRIIEQSRCQWYSCHGHGRTSFLQMLTFFSSS